MSAKPSQQTKSSTRMAGYPTIRMLIGGAWIEAPGAPVIDPATGDSIGTVPHATAAHLESAVAAAARGFAVWRRTAPAERARIMLRAAQLVRDRVDAIAWDITLEQGKPLAQSRAEVLRGCDLIEWDATEARRIYGRVIPAEPGMRHTVLREPVGVVAAFTPWNFPMSSPARKIGGALAAGCAIILKASEETPAGAMHLARAFVDAGLPAGVLNLVFGDPAAISGFLIPHPAVRLVTFTGSTVVGKQLAGLAGTHMKPVIMELGGHAPVIVCDDADPQVAAAAGVQAKLNNAGQVCVAPTRFIVHRAVYDAFVRAFTDIGRAVRQGSGLDPHSDIGPVANARRLEGLQRLTDDAVRCGARVLCGGAARAGAGFHFPFTALADVPTQALAMREEPFGPLSLITPVDSLEDGIALANSLPFGLAGYAFTASARNARLLSDELEVGNLAINHFVSAVSETPFGGVKDSGYGREGGTEGLECYTHAKSVSHLTA
ncbi:MAG TPA: NAD-dependent succinate-semialdehyde dehydrogenase [Bordetella sp.]|nr:NAD-dependent succinate-semialdehyde dehydrogenase [Bordetella sp.]